MYVDISDNDRKLIGTGEKTIADGEIFNDYENNKAIDKSTAIGMDNIAGTKAFAVKSVLENGFVLSNITNLKDTYKYSIKKGSDFEFNIGTITAINTNTKEIIVDKMPSIDLTGTIYLFTLDDTSVGDTLINAWEDFSVYPSSEAHLAISVEGRHNIGMSAGSHVEGCNNKALGYFSHAEGRSVTAAGTSSHAEGKATIAKGDSAHAEGSKTNALGYSAHAEGADTYAHSAYCHAEGISTQAGTENIGSTSKAAHAEGFQTVAIGSYSHAEGDCTTAEAQSSHAEGAGSKSTGLAAHAEGAYTEASGPRSHSEGRITKATHDATHAEGNCTIASGNASHAEGLGSIIYPTQTYSGFMCNVESSNCLAIDTWMCGTNFISYLNNKLGIDIAKDSANGVGSSITKRHLLIELLDKTYVCKLIIAVAGENVNDRLVFELTTDVDSNLIGGTFDIHRMVISTAALATASHAEGYLTIAKGELSHSEGNETRAFGYAAHTEGGNSQATAEFSHAEGGGTTASGWGAHAEGNGCTASESYAHAEGTISKAKGPASHAENYNTNAEGTGSHAEGRDTFAKGAYSHAEGEGCVTSEDAKRAHAEGHYSTASGIASHAEGVRCKAKGKSSHAEGSHTEASGDYSHTTGLCTQTLNECQMALGRANEGKTNTLFEIGGGKVTPIVSNNSITGYTVASRANLFEVYDDGSLGLKGTTGILKFTPEMIDKLYETLSQLI